MSRRARKSQLTASGRAAVVSRLRKRARRAARTAKENADLSASGLWVRYMSASHPGYRVVVSPRMIQAFGPPRDPWGEKMRPAEGTAPRRLDAPRGRSRAAEQRAH